MLAAGKVKKALVDRLDSALEVLDFTAKAYRAYPSDTAPDCFAVVGGAETDVEDRALGRGRRDESLTVHVDFQCYSAAGPEAAYESLIAMLSRLEAMLADDATLGLDEVLWARLAGWNDAEGPLSSDAAGAVAVGNARLTVRTRVEG